jgi:hypothetical protein
MTETGDPAAPSRDLGPLEALGRVARVFYAPRHAAGEIRDRPNWVFPLLLSVFFSLLLSTAVFSRPEWQEALQKALAGAPKALGELERVQLLKTMRVMAYGAVVVAVVVGNLFLALLLWGTAVLLEGRTKFLTVFSLQLHAQMVTVIPQALGLGILLARRGNSLEGAGDPLPFSLAYFLSAQGVAPLLRAFASAVDLFSLWYWGLVLLGLPIVAGLPRRKLLVPVLVLWIVGVLVRAATLSLAIGNP